jgi:hypothetical protein
MKSYEQPDRKSDVNDKHFKGKYYNIGKPPQGILTKGHSQPAPSQDPGGSGQRASDPQDGKFSKG